MASQTARADLHVCARRSHILPLRQASGISELQEELPGAHHYHHHSNNNANAARPPAASAASAVGGSRYLSASGASSMRSHHSSAAQAPPGAGGAAPGSITVTVGPGGVVTAGALSAGQHVPFESIPEVVLNGRELTLVQRVQQLEGLLAQYRPQMQASLGRAGVAAQLHAAPGAAAAGGSAGGAAAAAAAANGAASTKSAPQGSLLFRVEALEEALSTLVSAYQVRAGLFVGDGLSRCLAC